MPRCRLIRIFLVLSSCRCIGGVPKAQVCSQAEQRGSSPIHSGASHGGKEKPPGVLWEGSARVISPRAITQRFEFVALSRGAFCNQLRQKIGVVYGNPETTTGGNALKFYCSVRLDIRRKKAIKRGDETIGSECKVKVVKNKLAPPFREADFEILYGTGVNKLGELVDTAEKLGVVEKSGTWYSYDGTKIGQGRDKVLAHLDEHPAMQQQLREQLIRQARLAAVTPSPAAAAAAGAAS